MKKKLLSLLLALTVALSLAACGGNGENGGSAASGDTSVTVSDSADTSADGDTGAISQPEEVITVDSQTEPEEQSAQEPAQSPTEAPSSGTSKPSPAKPESSKPSPAKPDASGGSTNAVKTVDLGKFYTDTTASLTQPAEMMELSADLLTGLYPGLTELNPKQTVAYMAMISATACELVAVELGSSEDAKAAQAILQQRVTDQGENQGAFYPETIEQWKNNSRIAVNGNYVLLAVGPDADTYVTAFNALTK